MHAIVREMERWSRILILAGAIVLLAGAGALTLTVLVPRVVNSRIREELPRLQSACDCEIDYSLVRYGMRRGVSVIGLRVQSAGEERPSFQLQADRLRLTLGPVRALRLYRAIGGIALPSDRVPSDPRELSSWIEPTLASLDTLAITLPEVTLESVQGTANTRSQRLTIEQGQFTLDSRAPAEAVTVHGTVRAAVERVGREDEGRAALGAGGQLEGLLSVSVEESRLAGTLSEAEIAFGDPLSGRLSGRINLVLRPSTPYAFEGDLALSGGRVFAPALATSAIEDLELAYNFSGTLDPRISSAPVILAGSPPLARAGARGLLQFHRGELVINGLSVEFLPRLLGIVRDETIGPDITEVRLPREPTTDLVRRLLSIDRYLDLVVRLDSTDAERVRSALPEAILGPLAGMRLRGRVGWELDLHVPLHQVSSMSWTSTVPREEFGVDQLSWDTNVYKLNGAFLAGVGDPATRTNALIPAMRLPSSMWTSELSEFRPWTVERWREADAELAGAVAASPPAIVRDGETPEPLEMNPAYRYVRLERMSRWVPRAILTAEDGDFFYHHGVNFYTLPRALERNLIAGEIQFGASTISMQLVKMLFLDAGRVVSRKLQEVFLVHLMESVVPVAKERILELYINLAEFGPGVYGIADASWYYFRKNPSQLTAGEAVWIASVLPSPRRYHQYYAAGAISPGWFERMKGYFAIMLERERMTAEEYADAIIAPPRFAYATPSQSEDQSGE